MLFATMFLTTSGKNSGIALPLDNIANKSFIPFNLSDSYKEKEIVDSDEGMVMNMDIHNSNHISPISITSITSIILRSILRVIIIILP